MKQKCEDSLELNIFFYIENKRSLKNSIELEKSLLKYTILLETNEIFVGTNCHKKERQEKTSLSVQRPNDVYFLA